MLYVDSVIVLVCSYPWMLSELERKLRLIRVDLTTLFSVRLCRLCLVLDWFLMIRVRFLVLCLRLVLCGLILLFVRSLMRSAWRRRRCVRSLRCRSVSLLRLRCGLFCACLIEVFWVMMTVSVAVSSCV